jgi:hypothetical protein
MYYTFQILLIIYSFGLILLVWQFTRRDLFRPAYAILWLLTASVFAVLSVFPKPLFLLAELLRFADVPSVLIAMGLSFATVLLIYHTVLISGWSRNTKALAQEIAILRWRLEQLEQKQGEPLNDEKEKSTEFDEILVNKST